MIYIPVDYLKDGMILAQDVDTEIGVSPLLAKGQVLKEKFINRFRYFNITGVYIESSFSSEIQVEPIIGGKLKAKVLTQLKGTFKDFGNTGKLMAPSIQSLMKVSDNLVDSLLSNKEVLINLVGLKGYDDYTYQHSFCVAIIAVSIGNNMGLDKMMLKQLALSGLFHDIGKMSVPKEILNKTGKLTDEEFEVIKQHPETAFKQLRKTNLIPDIALRGIRSHHERFDGSGYLKNLSGEGIPLLGRILAVADVYDALTSNRPYRKACLSHEVIEYMMGNANIQFDYEVLTAFLKSVVAYPAGMLVTLSNGKKAMVIENNRENTLRPVVRLIQDNKVDYTDIDLLNDPEYRNITILGMGYDDSIDFVAISEN
jgi:putative nucleotidyltransferase with HDIG domain